MKNKLNIDVICNDGSPLGVVFQDIYGENGRVGVGGAELALLTMCEGWHDAGHRVRLYNSPTKSGGSPFHQYPIDTFLPQEDRDILIIFRSPNHRALNAVGKKIWWSCDQYTVGDFAEFSNHVDRIVTISQFHADHFKNTYNITDTVSIDLPVRLADYIPITDKKLHSMIFCSVPDRGLDTMAQMFPYIKSKVSDATLTITSDYRLWGLPDGRNENFIRKFLGMDGVKFVGALPRREMVIEQLKAEIQSYPCVYDELFCYSVAECSVAGAYPVTSSQGSLETTNMGIQVEGDAKSGHWMPGYADKVIETLLDPNLKERQQELMRKAIDRFDINKIIRKWDELFYE